MAQQNTVLQLVDDDDMPGLPPVASDRDNGYMYADQCRDLIESGAVTLTDFAKELGCSPAKVSEYYKRRYNQVSADTRQRFDRQVGAALKRRTIQERLNRKDLYLLTSHAERLEGYLDHCFTYNKIRIIRAPTGIGKSHVCRHYQRKHENVYVMMCRSSRRSGRLFIADLYACVLGEKLDAKKKYYEAEDAIFDALNRKSALLILDDAHKLSIRTLDFVVELHDSCDKLGVVMLDQSDAIDSPGFNRAIEFERNPQILRRIGGKPWSLEFPITQADVEAFTEHFGISSAEVVQWMCGVVNLPETRYDWLSEMVVNAAETFRERPDFLNLAATYKELHKKLRRGE